MKTLLIAIFSYKITFSIPVKHEIYQGFAKINMASKIYFYLFQQRPGAF